MENKARKQQWTEPVNKLGMITTDLTYLQCFLNKKPTFSINFEKRKSREISPKNARYTVGPDIRVSVVRVWTVPIFSFFCFYLYSSRSGGGIYKLTD